MRSNKKFWIIIALSLPVVIFAEELAHQAIRGDLAIYEHYLSSDNERNKLNDLRRQWEQDQSFNFLDERSRADITAAFQKAMESEMEDRNEAGQELEELKKKFIPGDTEWEKLDEAFRDYTDKIAVSPQEVVSNVPLRKIHAKYSEMLFVPDRPDEPEVRIYTVQAGDFLIRIAERLYKDYKVWLQIYEDNRKDYPQWNNPNLIQPGMTLRLPRQ
jgi:hypothetical protein